MSKHWWQQAVIYQIYPRSFQDSNGDGVGDLPGIISRLDYLQQLGVDALWLSPVYLSPNADNGYDIADYQAINPEYGTMADMQQLLAETKKRKMRIIMDLVVNHTSSEHQWFVEARKHQHSATRDFYIWADPVNGHEPNGLQSGFIGASAWEYDQASKQYFLHLFSKKQIDLNWDNPNLRQTIYAMMNWWLDQGVSGFRLDVVDMLGKDWRHEQVVNGPHLHDYLHEMNRATFGRGDYLTVGEAWSADPNLARQYSDEANQELSMIFQFGFTWADRVVGGDKWETKPLDIAQLKEALYANQLAMADSGWPSLFWNNHDLPRVASRFGNGSALAAKMLAIALHGLRGTPYVYQGEELGMLNRSVTTISEVDDVEAQTIYRLRLAAGDTPKEALKKINVFNRDQARTPMQWDDTLQAGFTSGQSWLAVNDDYHQINAAQQVGDPQSVFTTYQQLINLRHTQPVLQSGKFAVVSGMPDQVMAYTRRLEDQTWLIVANFADTAVTVDLPVSQGKPFVTNGLSFTATGPQRELQAYEAFMVSVNNR